MVAAGTSPDVDHIPDELSLSLSALRESIDHHIDQYLSTREKDGVAAEEAAPVAALRGCVRGGKRLRPLLCVLGWHVAGGTDAARHTCLDAATALELLHTAAVIHDDLMDDSGERRGRPSAHRALAAMRDGPEDQAAAHGRRAAIALGDLALVWADDLLTDAAVATGTLTRVQPLKSVMRTEMVYGQWQDLRFTGTRSSDVESALRIAHYKTAAYTVRRPLEIGATLAGADPRLVTGLADAAIPLGEAFQLRDDLNDVFGLPGRPGTAAGEDVTGGKHTVLMATALRRATPSQQRLLHAAIGRDPLPPTEADAVREVLEATGARRHVEELITERLTAWRDLFPRDLPIQPAALLHELADTLIGGRP